MCDYSLHGVANRPATVRDNFCSTNFMAETLHARLHRNRRAEGSRVSAARHRARVEQEVEVDHVSAACCRASASAKPASGRALPSGQHGPPDTHHDALEFPNGKIVLVTRLCPGQKATVLQLSVTAKKHHVDEPTQPKSPADCRRRLERQFCRHRRARRLTTLRPGQRSGKTRF